MFPRHWNKISSGIIPNSYIKSSQVLREKHHPRGFKFQTCRLLVKKGIARSFWACVSILVSQIRLQIIIPGLTLVLELCSAVTSSAWAGTTDTCHGPSSGSSGAVVLGKKNGQGAITDMLAPSYQLKSILIMHATVIWIENVWLKNCQTEPGREECWHVSASFLQIFQRCLGNKFPYNKPSPGVISKKC